MNCPRYQKLLACLVIILCIINAAILGNVIEARIKIEKNARDCKKISDRVSLLEAKLLMVQRQLGDAI